MINIDDTQLGFDPAWEGELAASSDTFTMRGDGKAKASIGQPTYWALGTPQPPAAVAAGAGATGNGRQYGLARFPFSLWPSTGQRVVRADFSVALYPSGSGIRPFVYDAYPATTTVDREGEVSASLGPDFKFGGAEASLGGVEGTIKLKRTVAAITVYGLGESEVNWSFQERGDHLLAGSIVVYAVVALPPEVTAARAVVNLTASINTPFGRFVGRTPDAIEARLSRKLA